MAKEAGKPQNQVTLLDLLEDATTNEEVLAALAEFNIEVKTEPVIIDIQNTQTDNGKAVFLMAEVTAVSSGSKLTRAQLRVKGFTNSSFILRCIEWMPDEVLEENGWEVGSTLEGMALQIQDSIEPWYDEQPPRINRDEQLLVDENGNEVYRQAVLIDEIELNGGEDEETGEVFEALGHQTIAVKPVDSEVEAKPTVSKKQLTS
jgi:hypothetical protein